MKFFKNLKSETGFVPVAVILVILIIAGFVFYAFHSRYVSKNAASPVYQVVKRSKELGYISTVTTSKGVDQKTNKPINPTANFTPTDNPIYLVADVNNPPVGSRIDYIRYLNGRYVDHRSVEINQAGTKAVVFDWTTTVIGVKRPMGAYRVKLYANGILEKRVNYNVGAASAELYIGNFLNQFI